MKGNIKNISISYKIGVSTNNQLAFRYTYRVWHFIGQKFPALRQTVNDFEYEKTIADVNRKLTGIETFILFTEPEHTHISSSIVRELLRYGKDISQFVPKETRLY